MPALLDQAKAHAVTALGGDVVPLAAGDGRALDAAAEQAALDYWTALPYLARDAVDTGFGTRAHDEPIAAVLDRVLGDGPARALAYLTGAVETESAPEFAFGELGAFYDVQLIGADAISRNRADGVLGNILAATYRDLAQGEVAYTVDAVRGVVRIEAPTSVDRVDVMWTIGFEYGADGAGLDYVNPAHRDLFRRMVLRRFLDSLIVARSAMTLTSDVGMDVSPLVARRDALEADIAAELIAASPIVPRWG